MEKIEVAGFGVIIEATTNRRLNTDNYKEDATRIFKFLTQNIPGSTYDYLRKLIHIYEDMKLEDSRMQGKSTAERSILRFYKET